MKIEPVKYEQIDRQLISDLAQVESDSPVISLYLPLTARFESRGKNITRIKNLLANAAEQVGSESPVGDGIRDMLDAARSDSDWLNLDARAGDGAAILIDRSRLRIIMLPNEPEELAVVAPSFHLKPLFEATVFDTTFFVLTLASNDIGLYRGNSRSLEPVPSGPDTPASLAEALGHQLSERQLQHHAGAAGSTVAIHHGHGSGKDDTDAEVERFLRLVTEGLQQSSLDGSAMILAGVDELTAHYRRITDYDHILDNTVRGNVESISFTELSKKAWEIFYEDYCRRSVEAMKQIAAGEASRPGTADLDEIVLAAADGRIAKLFVASDSEIWGLFSRGERRVTVHKERQLHDTDLLDRAAALAWQTDAEVCPLRGEYFPANYSAVALLRYEVTT